MARTAAELVCLVATAAACAGQALAVVIANAPAPAGPSYGVWKKTQAEVAAEAAAVEAKNAKMAAVAKVVALLEGLRSQVLSEGEAEAQTYNKFACFCKDTTAEKSAAISKGTDEKTTLTGEIEQGAAAREGLDATIATQVANIAKAEKDMQTAKAVRASTLKVYETNNADLSAAIAALEGAVASLKTSKTPSLAQIRSVAKTMRTAALLADALGVSSEGAASFLLQVDPEVPDVPMENYKFHSEGIIATLEKLLKDFRAEKVKVDAEEVASISDHEKLMQDRSDFVKLERKNLDDAKKAKAAKQEEIAMKNARLTTVAATLLDDQEYLKKLSDMCSAKATTWDQRSQVRQDELSALTAAISAIKGAVSGKTTAATLRLVSVHQAEATARSTGAMEAAEADAEAAEASDVDAPPDFLQLAATSEAAPPADDGRRTVAELLRKKGQQLRSTVLSALAGKIAEDPFAKVKTLIQELIERLLEEASKESNHKDWCDKSTSDAEQKRDYAAGEVDRLNAHMAGLEATRDRLAEELSATQTEMSDLKDSRSKAEKMRADESAENARSVADAEAGLVAVVAAADTLSKFYKTIAKESVDFSLAQRGPAEDAPDAGFKIGEAYVGAQGEASGILGMLDVIKSDFQRTITETRADEAEAVQAHYNFMTETGKSLAAKTQAESELLRQKSDTEDTLATAEQDMRSQMDILKGAIGELLDLKPACVDTGMTYADRVARREDEIEALKKGLCILEHYAQYGPAGGADTC